MLEKKWLGDKAGQGFYKKAGKDEQGRDVRLVLDWKTLEYGPSVRPKFQALEMAKNVEVDDEADCATVAWAGMQAKDKAAAFYWPLLTELFTYAANRLPPVRRTAIAASVVEIDAAMRTGFNWELGPFEMFDAAGVKRDYREDEGGPGLPVAANVERLLAAGGSDPSWYADDAATVASGRVYFDPATGGYQAGAHG